MHGKKLQGTFSSLEQGVGCWTKNESTGDGLRAEKRDEMIVASLRAASGTT